MNPIIFLILAVLPTVGFLAGAAIAKQRAPRLTRSEKRELEALRRMRRDLIESSAQHIALGEPYASIVFDTVGRHLERGYPE